MVIRREGGDLERSVPMERGGGSRLRLGVARKWEWQMLTILYSNLAEWEETDRVVSKRKLR